MYIYELYIFYRKMRDIMIKKFKKVLVANRGEIAIRIF